MHVFEELYMKWFTYQIINGIGQCLQWKMFANCLKCLDKTIIIRKKKINFKNELVTYKSYKGPIRAFSMVDLRFNWIYK